MKTYTIETVTIDGNIETITIKAQNLKEAVKEAVIDTACLKVVFRYEGRKGEYNEYVEFDPRRLDGVVFIAQKSGEGGWYVYENHPGRKGKCITLAHYCKKYLAVTHAQKIAHA